MCIRDRNTQKREEDAYRSVTEHTNDTRYRFEREHERCRPQHFIYARSCERSSGRLARGGGRCRLGEGEGGAGEGQEGSHEVEVVAGGSGGGVHVIKPAPVYNTRGLQRACSLSNRYRVSFVCSVTDLSASSSVSCL